MKTANFIIQKVNDFDCPEAQIITNYSVEYSDAAQLKLLYEEARCVWDEYFVMADCDGYMMTASHTYKDEVKAGFIA